MRVTRPQRERPLAHRPGFDAYEVLPLALADVAHARRRLRPGIPHDRRARAVLVDDDASIELGVDDLNLLGCRVDAVGGADEGHVPDLGCETASDLVEVAGPVQALDRHVLDVADGQVGVHRRLDREGVIVFVRQGQAHVELGAGAHVEARAQRMGV